MRQRRAEAKCPFATRMRDAPLRDDWPVAADGVIQSMVTLGPDIMETIVDQVRALFERMAGRPRRTGVE